MIVSVFKGSSFKYLQFFAVLEKRHQSSTAVLLLALYSFFLLFAG